MAYAGRRKHLPKGADVLACYGIKLPPRLEAVGPHSWCVLQNVRCSTLEFMRLAIQARLDERSRKRLAVLVRELGWTPSQVVREGLRVLEASYLRRKRRGVIGLGKFRSGVADLGSNKKHLRDFGR